DRRVPGAHAEERRVLEEPLQEVGEVLLPGVPVVAAVGLGAVELVAQPDLVELVEGLVRGVVRVVRRVADIDPYEVRDGVDLLDRLTGLDQSVDSTEEAPGAEDPDARELSGIAGQDVERLPTTHRQAGQRALARVAGDVVLALGGAGDVAEQLVGE